LIDALAFFFDAIAYEMKFRRAGQIQRKTELLTNIRRCVLQSRQRRFVLLLVTGDGDINASGTFIRGETNISYIYTYESRIFELIADDLCDLFSQSIRKSFRSAHNTLQFSGRDAFDDVSLDLVSNLHVVEVFQTDTALEPFANL